MEQTLHSHIQNQPQPARAMRDAGDGTGSLYLVTIHEVCARTVLIHAESEGEARAEARRMWADDILVPSDEPAWREIDWVDIQPA